MFKPCYALLPLALLLSPLTARADQFIYAGAVDGPAGAGADFNFTYVSSHLIRTAETVTPLTCVVKGQSCNTLNIDPGSRTEPNQFGGFEVSGPNGVRAAESGLNPFAFPGPGLIAGNDATLAVIDLPTPAPYFYDFAPQGYAGSAGDFSFTTDELITSRTTISGSVCCSSPYAVTFDPRAGTVTGTWFGNDIDLRDLPASFFEPGFNNSNLPNNSASLLVVATEDASDGGLTVTPEPSSLLLLGSGVTATAGLVRRRRRAL